VTSVVPTQDESTYLVMTLDGHIRLMDGSSGKMLNDFTGHAHESYRTRACFGHAEASVVAGDEKGEVWAWDLLDVRLTQYTASLALISLHTLVRVSPCSRTRHRKCTIRSLTRSDVVSPSG
jgi:hypothetical protein